MIRHLAETTNAVESNRRLLKWILLVVYAAIWALFIPFFWWATWWDVFPGAREIFNSQQEVYLFFYPLCTGIITLLIGAGGYFGMMKWLYIPINGIMCILSYGATWRLDWWLGDLRFARQAFVLSDFLKDYLGETKLNSRGEPLAGIAAAAAGLIIGSFIRYYRIVKKKQEDDKAF